MDVAAPGAKIPREIPREFFQPLQEIGAGAFGMVYKGLIKDPTHTLPEFPVATKVLHHVDEESFGLESELLLEV